MPSLRIALAFLTFLAAWIVFLPRQPTLLSPTPAVEEEVGGIEASAPAAEDRTASVETDPTRLEPAVPVREIVPSPLAEGGELRRMPAAASGAATPVAADLEAAKPGDEPVEATPADPPEVAALEPAEPKPDFRRFSQPIAIDSGTVQAGATTLRVAGVEPIAPDARCSDGDRSWPCGIRARTAFRAWLRGRSLLCSIPADAGDDVTVPCLLGEEDVGQWLVSNGWAAAAAGSRYETAQAAAKEARRGIWEFEIEQP